MEKIADIFPAKTIWLGLNIEWISLQPEDQGECLFNYFNKDDANVDDDGGCW